MATDWDEVRKARAKLYEATRTLNDARSRFIVAEREWNRISRAFWAKLEAAPSPPDEAA